MQFNSAMTTNTNGASFSASGTPLTRFEWSGAEYSRARKTGDWMITQDADPIHPKPKHPRFLARKNKSDSNGSTGSTDSAGSIGSIGSTGRVIISRFPDSTIVNVHQVRAFATETQSAFFSKAKKTTPSGRKIKL
jgi:hypothetical protein